MPFSAYHATASVALENHLPHFPEQLVVAHPIFVMRIPLATHPYRMPPTRARLPAIDSAMRLGLKRAAALGTKQRLECAIGIAFGRSTGIAVVVAAMLCRFAARLATMPILDG